MHWSAFPSADSENFAYLVKLLFALRHLDGYVFACVHTFVYVILLIKALIVKWKIVGRTILIVKKAKKKGKVIEILAEEHKNYEIVYGQLQILRIYEFL